MRSMSRQPRKPIKWVGFAKRDMDLIHARLKAAKLDFEAWQTKQGAR